MSWEETNMKLKTNLKAGDFGTDTYSGGGTGTGTGTGGGG